MEGEGQFPVTASPCYSGSTSSRVRGFPEQLTVDHCSATHLRSTFAWVRVGAVGRVARAQVVVVGQFFTRLNASPRMHENPIPLDEFLPVGVAGVIHERDAVPLRSATIL